MAEDFILRVRGELDLSSAERQWSTFISSKDKTSFVVKANLDFGNSLKEIDEIKAKIAKEFEKALGVDSKTAKRYANTLYNESSKEHKKYIADVNKAEEEVAANKRKQLQIATREESARRKKEEAVEYRWQKNLYNQEQKNIKDVNKAEEEVAANKRKRLQVASREESARRKKEEAVESRWQKNLYNQEQAQAKQIAKIKENDLKQTRKADASDKKRQAQQQIAEMKANAYSKNAHNNSLVESGKSNIARWTSEYKDRVKQIAKMQSDFQDGKFLSKSSSMSKSLRPYSDQNTDLLKQARQYESIYNNAYSNIQRHFNPEDSFKLNDKALLAYFNNMETSAKRFGNTMKSVSNESSGLVSMFEATTASNKTLNWLNNNTKAAKKYGDALQNLAEKQKNVTERSEARDLQNQVNDLKSKAALEGLTGNSIFTELGRGFNQIKQFVGVYGGIQKAVDTVRDLVVNVKEVDSAMTNLYKVTDETSAKYSSFQKDSGKTAIDLGRTMSSYIDQTATWAKLGNTLSDSAKLAKTSSIYANVGEVDDETAVSDIVTAMKAFNIQAQDSIQIVDQLNILGNKYATSSKDIGEGLKNSASVMALAGNSIQETEAMITGGAEITQEAGELGNALKISTLRLRGMKGELEELGEDVEDIDSVSKIQTHLLNLTKGQVNIFDDLDPTKFKSTFEIFKDIAGVYDSLTETDQADLLETVAGKHQANRIAALLESFKSGQVDSALNDAMNSEGSAQAEQDRWITSLDAKINQFNAAKELFANTLIDSDFLKGIVDFGTSGLSVLDGLISKFGSLNTIVATVAAGLSMFKNVGGDRDYISYQLPLDAHYNSGGNSERVCAKMVA